MHQHASVQAAQRGFEERAQEYVLCLGYAKPASRSLLLRLKPAYAGFKLHSLNTKVVHFEGYRMLNHRRLNRTYVQANDKNLTHCFKPVYKAQANVLYHRYACAIAAEQIADEEQQRAEDVKADAIEDSWLFKQEQWDTDVFFLPDDPVVDEDFDYIDPCDYPEPTDEEWHGHEMRQRRQEQAYLENDANWV